MIILASKSGVRKKIMEQKSISCKVVPSNVDEDQAKLSLQAAGADPEMISKNLAELKSIKVSKQFPNELVLGADSVISLDNKLINKPASRREAMEILKKLNGAIHFLISSVCISKNSSMIWNYTDKSELKMKNLSDNQLEKYLSKIKTESLLAYGVYQIEAGGLELFEYVKGDKNSIMGLPIDEINKYIERYKNA